MIDFSDITNPDLLADIADAVIRFRREHHFENGGAFVIIRPMSFDRVAFCAENQFNFVPCGVGESICTALQDAGLWDADILAYYTTEIVRVADYQIDNYQESRK